VQAYFNIGVSQHRYFKEKKCVAKTPLGRLATVTPAKTKLSFFKSGYKPGELKRHNLSRSLSGADPINIWFLI